ncbi:hypothetical protein PG995_004817 [Apiospora arundinis]
MDGAMLSTQPRTSLTGSHRLCRSSLDIRDDARTDAGLFDRDALSVSSQTPYSDLLIGVEMANDGLSFSDSALNIRASTHCSNEDDKPDARGHQLYKNAAPWADGLFHCPWERQPSCNHQPAKLKCNYDKFVDSHLKPYRCKVDSCQNLRFSSTACLLRHEREAHAMHGHGDKPYACTYEDCSRSLPENGFSRNWNLKDHMRRVHNDYGSSINSQNGLSFSRRAPASVLVRSRKKDPNRSSKTLSHRRKLALELAPADDAVDAARTAEQALTDRWYEHRSAMQQCLEHYDNPAAFDFLK